MYNMTITMATRKEISQWILANKSVHTSDTGFEVAKIENKSPISTISGTLHMFLDKNNDKYTLFCEDDETHYDEDEIDINLHDVDINYENLNYFRHEAIFEYITRHINKEFA